MYCLTLLSVAEFA